MKPTQEQQEFIKEKLLGMLKVRETYEELYDHIISALETVPEDVPFLDAVDNVIENSLGGRRGIRAIQARYVKIAIKEFIADYFRCIGRCLTSYTMLIIIPAVIIYYLLMQYDWFNGAIRETLPIFINIVPAAIITSRTIKARIKQGQVLRVDHAKSNIKPFGNIFMLFFPIMLWELMSIGCMFLQNIKLLTRQIGYYGMPVNVATVVFFIILVHAATYYKLYKDWDKAIMAS
jgi:hypothetical protein